MAELDKSRHFGDTVHMREESDLTSLNVSLPKTQRQFVESEAARSGCTTTSEYIRRLIHDAQRRTAQEELERKLIEGLESGPAVPFHPEFFDRMRERLRGNRGARDPNA